MTFDHVVYPDENDASSTRRLHPQTIAGLETGSPERVNRDGRLVLRAQSSQAAPSFLYFSHTE
jgi:hypothetical protein